MSKIETIHCFDCFGIINYSQINVWDEYLEIQVKVCQECAEKRNNNLR